ncbi:MAG: hypothetical protein WC516_03345 [Patescibacteria group bacterium]
MAAPCQMSIHRGKQCICARCPRTENPGPDECGECLVCGGPHDTCPRIVEEGGQQPTALPICPREKASCKCWGCEWSETDGCGRCIGDQCMGPITECQLPQD